MGNMTIEVLDATDIHASKTRQLLICAAIKLFARYGYAGASTRAISDYAGVNQALINYHFKNKRGLYLAVFERIKDDIIKGLGNRLNKVFQLSVMDRVSHPVCIDAIFALSDNVIEILLSDEMDDKAQLLLREQQSPSEAFNIVYDKIIEPSFECMHKLLLHLNDNISPKDLRIFTITLFAQIIAFRSMKSAAKRYLEWSEFGESEIRKIKAIIRQNFIKLIDADL